MDVTFINVGVQKEQLYRKHLPYSTVSVEMSLNYPSIKCILFFNIFDGGIIIILIQLEK